MNVREYINQPGAILFGLPTPDAIAAHCDAAARKTVLAKTVTVQKRVALDAYQVGGKKTRTGGHQLHGRGQRLKIR